MKKIEMAVLAGIIPMIGAASFLIPKSPPIIAVNLIDISQSSVNYKFPSGQTYKSLMESNCRLGLDNLNTEDVYIPGKFTTEITSTAYELDYRVKNRQMASCSQITEPEARMRTQQGTSLAVAIDRLELEVTQQRSNDRNYPVAAIIAIDANETEPGKQPEDLKAIVKKVKTMVAKEHLNIAFVGLEVNLQKQLKQELISTAGVKFYTFQNIDEATKNTIKSARQLKPVK
jgi:hypothetical protein